MELKEPITLTRGLCGQVYVVSLQELTEYLDAFSRKNDEMPCCGEGHIHESEIVDYVLERLDVRQE